MVIEVKRQDQIEERIKKVNREIEHLQQTTTPPSCDYTVQNRIRALIAKHKALQWVIQGSI